MRIAIVDDDAGIRTNLARAVDRFDDCSCVGKFESGEAALTGLSACQPDVVLMDINMPGMDGIECVRRLKRANHQLEFIMLTVYEDTDSIFNALAAGASGYLLKRAERKELHEAIQQVRSGGSPMTSHIARKVVQSFRKPVSQEAETEKLTTRELQVLEQLAQGLLYKEIAAALEIGYDTVHNHIRHIYEKLEVRSRAQAVAKYLGKNPSPSPTPE
jgi:DNA-binding NarL/FixJ family response regulator